jgi:putative DNA primase/helicase
MSDTPALPENVDPGERQDIFLETADPHHAADAGIAALMAMPGPVVFQRGGQLVHIARRAPATARQKAAKVEGSQIAPVTLPLLRELLAEAAIWRSERKRKGGESEWVVVQPPRGIAEAIMARDQWKFPVLTGIITAPTLRPNLSVLDDPGHDACTGLYADYSISAFEAVRHDATRDEALAALDDILDLLDEVAFANDYSRSVALAMILTALVRQSLGGAPAIGISANVMATGKTYLGQIAPLLTQGRPAAVTAPPRDRKEEAKLIFSFALGGVLFLFFDNYENRVESDALCALLTSETYADRVLSITKTAEVSTAFMVIITGNGLTAAGDITARMLICHLDAKVDHPEHRRFKRNLEEWIPRHRGRLVPRALTFLRGFITAGAPRPAEPWARFPEWDRLIRGAILWADREKIPDPLLALRAGEKSDPRRMEHEALMAHWRREFGEAPKPIRAAVDQARSRAAGGDNAFKDALLDVAGERGEVNAKRLGHWMKKMAGRIQGRMRILAGEYSSGTATWSVELAKPGEAGF